METYKGKIRWINVQNPTPEDLSSLEREFGIHPIIIEELREPSSRDKAESYGSYLFFVFHFPHYDVDEKVSKRCEVDFVITKNAIITVHYDYLRPLEELIEQMDKAPRPPRWLDSSLLAIHKLLEVLIHYNRRQMVHIQEKLEEISANLFGNKEKETLVEISYLKRDISEHRIIVRPQEHLLRSLGEVASEFWGNTAKVYMSDILGEHMKNADILEDYRLAVMDYESTNVQLMNFKATKASQTFTILSFLTFPAMVLVALFAVRAGGVPLEDNPRGFWILTTIVGAGMLSMYLYFRKKEWL